MFKFCQLVVNIVSKQLQIIFWTCTVSNSCNGNMKELGRKKSVLKIDVPIGYLMLPLQMLISEVWVSFCNSIVSVYATRQQDLYISNYRNEMKWSAFGQKSVIYFWQSVNAILEDVSVAKTILRCKNINPKTFIFLCSKICGKPTNVT